MTDSEELRIRDDTSDVEEPHKDNESDTPE